jgi:hypothetical protein
LEKEQVEEVDMPFLVISVPPQKVDQVDMLGVWLEVCFISIVVVPLYSWKMGLVYLDAIARVTEYASAQPLVITSHGPR